MKRSKIVLATLSMAAIIGSAFVVKSNLFADASVYCEASGVTTCTHKVNFRVEPAGTTTSPCGIPGTTPHVLNVCTNPATCCPTANGTKFTAVINAGK